MKLTPNITAPLKFMRNFTARTECLYLSWVDSYQSRPSSITHLSKTCLSPHHSSIHLYFTYILPNYYSWKFNIYSLLNTGVLKSPYPDTIEKN